MSAAPPVPLRDFFALLAAEGFVIGVDDHLRVCRVIETDTDWTLEKLRQVIRSIVTTDVRQRAAFDRVFDRFFDGAPKPVTPEPDDDGGDALSAAPRRSRWIAAAVIGCVAAAAVVGWLKRPTELEIKVAAPRVTAKACPADAACLDLGSRPPARVFIDGRDTGLSTPFRDLELAPGEHRLTLVVDGGERFDSTITLVAGQTKKLIKELPVARVDAGPAPVQEPPAQVAVNADQAPDSDDDGNAAAYAIGAGGLGILLVAAISWLRRRGRRRAFVPGPWSYRPRAPDAPSRPIFAAAELEDGAAHLTWRGQGAGDRLAVEPTVARTIEAGGFPVVVYAEPPPAPEYAVLVDTSRSARAWSAVADELLDGLANQGVRLRRFSFSGAPSVVTGADGRATTLDDLAEHADAILVVGDGAAGFDPLEDVRPEWVDTLRSVPRRLWLNPLPASRWSDGARVVAETTPMEHASVAAFQSLTVDADRPASIERPYPAVIERSPGSALARAALREHLGGPAFTCLAMCAHAGDPDPAIARWLADRLELSLSAADWMRLLTLPWFARGRWPAPLRDGFDSELSSAARAAIAELIEASEPAEGTGAHLAWRLEAARVQGDSGELRDLSDSPVHAQAGRQLASIGAGDRSVVRRLAVAAGVVAVAASAVMLSVDRGPVVFDPTDPFDVVVIDHESPVSSAEYSRDGKYILTRSGSLGAATRRVDRLGTAYSFGSGASAAAFSPDGTQVASASQDDSRTVVTWSSYGTNSENATMAGHTDTITAIAYSPDGTKIATASRDRSVRVWNVDGTLDRTHLGHEADVRAIAWGPDGSFVASVSDDATMRMWDMAGDTPSLLFGHSGPVTALAVSPKGDVVATGSDDGTARAWRGGESETLSGHQGPVVSVAFDGTGARIVTASADGTARIWRSDATRSIVLRGHGGPVASAEFSPDGTRVVTASSDGTARLWRADGAGSIALVGHTGAVRSARFSPDGRRVITASADGTARIWTLPLEIPEDRRGDDPEISSATHHVEMSHDAHLDHEIDGRSARCSDCHLVDATTFKSVPGTPGHTQCGKCHGASASPMDRCEVCHATPGEAEYFTATRRTGSIRVCGSPEHIKEATRQSVAADKIPCFKHEIADHRFRDGEVLECGVCHFVFADKKYWEGFFSYASLRDIAAAPLITNRRDAAHEACGARGCHSGQVNLSSGRTCQLCHSARLTETLFE